MEKIEEKLWYNITTRGHGKKLTDKKFELILELL